MTYKEFTNDEITAYLVDVIDLQARIFQMLIKEEADPGETLFGLYTSTAIELMAKISFGLRQENTENPLASRIVEAMMTTHVSYECYARRSENLRAVLRDIFNEQRSKDDE